MMHRPAQEVFGHPYQTQGKNSLTKKTQKPTQQHCLTYTGITSDDNAEGIITVNVIQICQTTKRKGNVLWHRFLILSTKWFTHSTDTQPVIIRSPVEHGRNTEFIL